MNDLQIYALESAGGRRAIIGSRPIANKRTGNVTINTSRGLTLNSALRKNEWEDMDSQIVAASVPPLRLVNMLVERGLTRRLGGLGSFIAQYNRTGEMTAASATMRGHASVEKDLVDFELAGVPVPVIAKEFEIDERLLDASRRMGDGLDVVNAAAAGRVVSEKMEDMLINGDANIKEFGQGIFGLTNEPNRNTGTATTMGGGDWTASDANITKSVAGMMGAAQADGYYGPYALLAAPNQYNEAALLFLGDGSGDTPADRIRRMQGVAEFVQVPQFVDGTVVLVQLTSDVIQVAYVPGYFPNTTREWVSGDQMLNSFKVLAVYTPLVKSSTGGKSGIVHITGA